MPKVKTIYLCGPIADRSDEECCGWRNRVTELWPGEVRNPMDRDYRGHSIDKDLAEKIVEDDLYDIHKSDGLIVYFDRPSVGTSMEIFYAHSEGKPIVLIDKSNGPLSPWLLNHVDAIVKSVEEAILKIAYLT